MVSDFLAAFENQHRLLFSPTKAIRVVYAEILERLLKKSYLGKVRLANGEEMVVRLSEPIYRNILTGLPYEPEVTSIIVRYLRPGGVFWDVGAHLGVHALTAGKIVGEKGRVVAFEPSPANFNLLEKNCRSSANLLCEQMAVGRTEQKTVAFWDFGESGSYYSSLKTPRVTGSYRARKIWVKMTTIDSYCQNHPRLTPDLIKIDAENAEMDILKGAQKILKKKKPALVLEVGDLSRDRNDRSRQCLDFLGQLGYCPWEYDFQKRLWKRHQVKKDYGDHQNLLFVGK